MNNKLTRPDNMTDALWFETLLEWRENEAASRATWFKQLCESLTQRMDYLVSRMDLADERQTRGESRTDAIDKRFWGLIGICGVGVFGIFATLAATIFTRAP